MAKDFLYLLKNTDLQIYDAWWTQQEKHKVTLKLSDSNSGNYKVKNQNILKGDKAKYIQENDKNKWKLIMLEKIEVGRWITFF